MRRAHARRAGIFASALCALPFAAIAADACHSTVTDAARAALAAAIPLSTKFEHGGALYSLDSCYGFTAPQTSGKRTSVELRVALPKGAHLAGIYHTHPGKKADAHTFSADDVATQRRLNVPSYIGVVIDDSLRVLDANTFAGISRAERGDGVVSRGRELVP